MPQEQVQGQSENVAKKPVLNFVNLVNENNTFQDLQNLQAISGYDIEMPSPDQFKESNPSYKTLSEEQLNSLYSEYKSNYSRYKNDVFAPNVQDLYYPNTKYIKNKGIPEYAIEQGKKVIPIDRLGMWGVAGKEFIQQNTEDELASSQQVFIDSNRNLKPLSRDYNTNDMEWVKGSDYGYPQFDYIWKEARDGQMIDANRIRGMFGDSKLESSALGSISKGLWSGSVPLIAKTVGQTVNIIGDLAYGAGELMNLNEGDKSIWENGKSISPDYENHSWVRFGSKLTNWANYSTKKNLDEQQAIFDNWSSALFNISNGITQTLSIMLPASAAGTIAKSLSGISKGIKLTEGVEAFANVSKIAEQTGLIVGAAEGASMMREEMVNMEIDPKKASLFSIPFGIATYMSERTLSANVIQNSFGRVSRNEIRQGLRETEELSLKTTGKKLKDLTEEQQGNLITKMWNKVLTANDKIKVLAEKGGMTRVFVGAGEEAIEEVVENAYYYPLETFYNGILLSQAKNIMRNSEGKQFNQNSDGRYYITDNGIKKEVSRELYESTLADIYNAKKVIDGEGLFKPEITFDDAAVAGISTFITLGFGKVFNTLNVNNKKAQQNFLIDAALKSKDDPNYINTVLSEFDSMAKEGYVNNNFDTEGNIITYGSNQVSKVDGLKSVVKEQVEYYKSLIDKYDITNPDLLKALGNDNSLLKDYISNVDIIEKSKALLSGLDINTEEGKKESLKLENDINIASENINDLQSIEDGTQYSKVFNNKIKQNSLLYEQAEKNTNKLFEQQGRLVNDELKRTDEYKQSFIENLNNEGIVTYLDKQNFDKDYNNFKINALSVQQSQIEERKQYETNVSDILKTVNVPSIITQENLNESIVKLKDIGQKLSENAPIYGMSDELSKHYTNIYESALGRLQEAHGILEGKINDITQEKAEIELEEGQESNDWKLLNEKEQELKKYVSTDILEETKNVSNKYRQTLQENSGKEVSLKDTYKDYLESIKLQTKENEFIGYGNLYDDIYRIDSQIKGNQSVEILKQLENDINQNIDLIEYRKKIQSLSNTLQGNYKIKQHISSNDLFLSENQSNDLSNDLNEALNTLKVLKQEINKQLQNRGLENEEINKKQIRIKSFVYGNMILNGFEKLFNEIGIKGKIDELSNIDLKLNDDLLDENTKLKISKSEKLIAEIESSININREKIFNDESLTYFFSTSFLAKENSTNRFYLSTREVYREFNPIQFDNIKNKTDFANPFYYMFTVSYLDKLNGYDMNVINNIRLNNLKDSKEISNIEQLNQIDSVISFIEGDSLLDRIIKIEQKNNEKRDAKAFDFHTKYYIKNSIYLKGAYGTGKTSHIMGEVFRLLSKTNKSKKYNIAVISLTSESTNVLMKSFVGLDNAITTPYTINDYLNGISSIDKYDMIVWDEAGGLSAETILKIQEKQKQINKNKKEAQKIIFLGDRTQMTSLSNNQPIRFIERVGLRPTPLTINYSTNEPQIVSLTKYFADAIITGVFKEMPKNLFYYDKEKERGILFKNEQSDVIDMFNNSSNGTKALIFLNKTQYDEFVKSLPKEFNNEDYLKNVFIIDYNEVNEKPFSIQGLRRDHVFVAFNVFTLESGKYGIADVKSKKSEIGYTFTSRVGKEGSLVMVGLESNNSTIKPKEWVENPQIREQSLKNAKEYEKKRLENIVFPIIEQDKKPIENVSKQVVVEEKTQISEEKKIESLQPKSTDIQSIEDISIGDIYEDKNGNVYSIDEIQKDDNSIIYIKVGRESYRLNAFKSIFKKLEKVNTDIDSEYEYFSNEAKINASNNGLYTYGTTYTVYHEQDKLSNIDKVRSIKPLLFNYKGKLDKQLFYFKRATLTDEFNNPIEFQNVLMVKLNPSKNQLTNLLKSLKGKQGLNELQIEALNDIDKGGLTNEYAYLMSLGLPEYGYIKDGKRQTISTDEELSKSYKELSEKIEQGFKNSQDKNIDRLNSNIELNKKKLLLRKNLFDKYIGNKNLFEPIYITDISDVTNESQGMVIYDNRSKVNQDELINLLQSKGKKGIQFTDLIFIKSTQNSPAKFIRRFAWNRKPLQSDPHVVYDTIKVDKSYNTENDFDVKLNDEYDLISKNKEISKWDLQTWNSFLNNTNLVQLILNNKSLIFNNKDLVDFKNLINKYFTFSGKYLNIKRENVVNENDIVKTEKKIFLEILSIINKSVKGKNENQDIIKKAFTVMHYPINVDIASNTSELKVKGDDKLLVTSAIDIHYPFAFVSIDNALLDVSNNAISTQQKETFEDSISNTFDNIFNEFGFNQNIEQGKLFDDKGNKLDDIKLAASFSFNNESNIENENNEEIDYSKESIYSLIPTFGSYDRTMMVRMMIMSELNERSYFGLGKEGTDFNLNDVSSFNELYNILKLGFKNFSLKGDDIVSTLNKQYKDLTKNDLFHLTTDEYKKYIFYKLSNEDIYNTIIKSIYPSFDVNKSDLIKHTDSTQYDSWKDFNPNKHINDVFKMQVELTPYKQFVNGKFQQWDGRSRIYLTELQTGLYDIGRIVNEEAKLDASKDFDYKEAFLYQAKKYALSGGENTVRGNTILSFLDRMFGIESGRSINDILEQLYDLPYKTENQRNRMYALENFQNYIISLSKSNRYISHAETNVSFNFFTGQYEYSTLIKDNEFGNVMKGKIKDDIIREFFDQSGNIQKSKLNIFDGKYKIFDITDKAILFTKHGQSISLIKYENGKYTINDAAFKSGQIQTLANMLGLKKIHNIVLNNLYYHNSNTNDDYGLRKIIGESSSISTSKPNEYTKDFLAYTLFNMALSVKSYIDISKSIADSSEKLKDKEINEEEYDKQVKKALSNYSEILKNTLVKENIKSFDGLESIVNDDVQVNSNDISIINPTVFFKFLEGYGKISQYYMGTGVISKHYRVDGSQFYNYQLPSFLSDRFYNGSEWFQEEGKALLLNDKAKEQSPFIAKVNGAYIFTNSFLDPNSRMKMLKLHEFDGIRSLYGTTNPILHDMNNMFIGAFLDSIYKSHRNKLEVLNIGIGNLSDSGNLFLGDIVFDSTGKTRLIDVTYDNENNIETLKVNDNIINEGVDYQFNKFKREYDISIKKLKTILSETGFNKEGFFTKFTQNKDIEYNDLNTLFDIEAKDFYNALKKNPDKYGYLLEAFRKSDANLTKDYNNKNGLLSLGNAAKFNTDSIYNKSNYDLWQLAKKDNTLTKLRDELFIGNLDNDSRFFNYINMLKESNYQYPSKLDSLKVKDGKSVYPYFSYKSKEVNPFFKAHFYANEIVMNPINDLVNGSQLNYENTIELSKRSGTIKTGGTKPITNSKYGIGDKMHVAIIDDIYINDPLFNKETKVGDGLMIGNLLVKHVIDKSYGGEYGPIDNGPKKYIYNQLKLDTGQKITLKNAVDYCSSDVYANSLMYRNMFESMLNATDKKVHEIDSNYEIGTLHNKFIEFYEEEENISNRNADKAVKKLWEWVIEESGYSDLIKNNLIIGHQFISGSKIANSRINSYNPEIHKGDYDFALTELDTNELRVVLNPYQDPDNVGKVTIMNQILSFIGNGSEFNKQHATNIYNALSKMYDLGKVQLNDEQKNGIKEYLRNRGKGILEGMGYVGNLSEILMQNNITFDLPNVTNILLSSHLNHINDIMIKPKLNGLRHTQSTGYLFNVYEKDGIIYTLKDIEKYLNKQVYDDNELTNIGFAKRRLKSMKSDNGKIESAEVFVPFSYFKQFGFTNQNTLNDVYTLHYENGNMAHFNNVESSVFAKHIISNINKLSLYYNENPMLKIVLDNYKKHNDKSILEKQIIKYLDSFKSALNIYSVRIPSNRLGSGFTAKIVGFIQDNANAIYIPAELTNLNDSDFDIDQLSTFFRTLRTDEDGIPIVKGDINSSTDINELNDINDLKDYILSNIEEVYSNIENVNQILIDSNIDSLVKLANEGQEGNKYNRFNEYATFLNDYYINQSGADAIGILARSLSAFGYLSLLESDLNKDANGFKKMIELIKQTGSESLLVRLGNYLQLALDNKKYMALGNMNINKNAVPTLAILIMNGYSDRQVKEFFSNKSIKDIFRTSSMGDSVTTSKRKYDLMLLTMQKLKEVPTFEKYQKVKQDFNQMKQDFIKSKIGSDETITLPTKEDFTIEGLKNLGLLEQKGDCIKIKANDGIDLTNKKASKWFIVNDITGPNHEQGGVNLTVKNNKVYFTNNDNDIYAENGLLILNTK